MAQDLKDNYAIKRGATYLATFIWKTGATVASATPVNLTGYTARCMLKVTTKEEVSEIVSISQAVDGVVETREPHRLKTNQSVVLPGVGGMVELTGRYTITVLTPNTFSIGVNTSSYTPYTSGGTVAFVSLTNIASGDGQLILGTTGGDVQLLITAATTALLRVGGSYDIELISGTGSVYRPFEGVYMTTANTTT